MELQASYPEGVFSNLLSWIVFLPMIGMAIILCLPKDAMETVKKVSLVFTGIPLVLATYLYFGVFDKSTSALQLVERFDWISLGAGENPIQYFVGVDGISLPLVWLTTLLLFIGVPASYSIKNASKSYYALLLLLEVGILGVFVSLDYFLFYVFWEIMLLPMYFLIGIWGGPRREYAAIKFFLYTLAGSVLMLVAVVALRIDSGTFSIPDLISLAQAGELTGASLPFGGELLGMKFTTWVFWFLFISFAIKVPVFPFHTWLPDAHVQAPTPISVILAGILLKLGGYGMLRACFPIVPDAFNEFAYALAVLGVISIVYGAFVALGQSDFKRMVAYSSVSHMGYVLLGMAALTEWGMNGAALQMFNHGTSSAALFLIVGVIYDRAHHRDLNGFGGMSQQMPVYWGLTTIGFFAALGLPGMAGFISEAMTLVGAYSSANPDFRVLVVISVLGIVITAAFLLWAMQRVFLGTLNEKYASFPDIDKREIFCQAPLLFLCIVLGIFPFYLLDWMEPSISNLVEILTIASNG
ncbi:MAG: NADH-quinone oxidoreductase subunit M [Planctomycetes bacterium]|nr:NADH-quinone oxidoreductase subunit M [Planctomycetota bacterium]